MTMKKRQGFTLVELLVVMSIISLLIALLLPALAGSRESSRRIACASQERQQGQSFFAYANDFKDRVVPAYCWSSAQDMPAWDFLLMGYMGYTRTYTWEEISTTPYRFTRVPIFACPSDNIPRTIVLLNPNPLRSYSTVSGCAQNGPNKPNQGTSWWFNYNSLATNATPIKFADLPLPSNALLLTENPIPSNAAGAWQGANINTPANQGAGVFALGEGIHLGTWNFLLADAHVSAMKTIDTIGPGHTLSDLIPSGIWTRALND